MSTQTVFLAQKLLGLIPNVAEEFPRIGLADFYLRGGTLPSDMVLRLLADHSNELLPRGRYPSCSRPLSLPRVVGQAAPRA